MFVILPIFNLIFSLTFCSSHAMLSLFFAGHAHVWLVGVAERVVNTEMILRRAGPLT